MEQPSVSKHLRVLKDVGLVSVRRHGRNMLYRTEAAALARCEWTSTFERLWSHQLAPHQRARRKDKAHDFAKFALPIREGTMTSNQVCGRPAAHHHPRDSRKASLERTFDAILDQLGPYNETPEGTPLPMKLEPWPGGRWFRDLHNSNGHFWATVQAIKRPTFSNLPARSSPPRHSFPICNIACPKNPEAR
jgi:hypothetical protein